MTGREIVERIREKYRGDIDPSDRFVSRPCCVKELKIQGDGRTLEFVATTDDIDLDQEVVVSGGLDPTQFKSHGNIFVNHSLRWDDVIGKMRTLTPFSRIGVHSGWKMTACFLPGKELADAVVAMAELGTVPVSIGFTTKDYGKPTLEEEAMYTRGGKMPKSIVRKANWFETSVVGIPCNPQAGSIGNKSQDEFAGLLDRLLTDEKITRKAAEAFGLRTKTRLVVRRTLPIVRSM